MNAYSFVRSASSNAFYPFHRASVSLNRLAQVELDWQVLTGSPSLPWRLLVLHPLMWLEAAVVMGLLVSVSPPQVVVGLGALSWMLMVAFLRAFSRSCNAATVHLLRSMRVIAVEVLDTEH